MIYTEIRADARKQVKATANNWPDDKILQDINNGVDEVSSLIQGADGDWQYDDANQPTTDQGDGTGGLPVATTSIVAGVQDTTLNVPFLKIEKVFIHQFDGDITWQELRYNPDKSRFLNINSTQDVGVPREFCLIGNSIFFDVYPNYSSVGGLAATYTRTSLKFGTGTGGTLATTAAPGWNSQFHKYLSLYAQREWLEAYEKGNSHLNKVIVRMQVMAKAITSFYSSKKKGSPQNLRSNIDINEYR